MYLHELGPTESKGIGQLCGQACIPEISTSLTPCLKDTTPFCISFPGNSKGSLADSV